MWLSGLFYTLSLTWKWLILIKCNAILISLALPFLFPLHFISSSFRGVAFFILYVLNVLSILSFSFFISWLILALLSYMPPFTGHLPTDLFAFFLLLLLLAFSVNNILSCLMYFLKRPIFIFILQVLVCVKLILVFLFNLWKSSLARWSPLVQLLTSRHGIILLSVRGVIWQVIFKIHLLILIDFILLIKVNMRTPLLLLFVLFYILLFLYLLNIIIMHLLLLEVLIVLSYLQFQSFNYLHLLLIS